MSRFPFYTLAAPNPTQPAPSAPRRARRRFAALALAAALGVLGAGPALAHVPLSSDPFKRQGCTAGLSNLGCSWAVLGALLDPRQVDSICFDAQAGDSIKAQATVPPKAAYDGPNDFTLVLVGPGLPPPGRSVPQDLPVGGGAVFGDPPGDVAARRRNYLGWWYGAKIDVTLPAVGRYEIRVWSPSMAMGEYFLTTDGDDPTCGSTDLSNTPLPLRGDLNGDGRVTDDDAFRALVIALGVVPVTDSYELFSADVAPTGDFDLKLKPGDGVVDLGDVTRILRRSRGYDAADTWPDPS